MCMVKFKFKAFLFLRRSTKVIKSKSKVNLLISVSSKCVQCIRVLKVRKHRYLFCENAYTEVLDSNPSFSVASSILLSSSIPPLFLPLPPVSLPLYSFLLVSGFWYQHNAGMWECTTEDWDPLQGFVTDLKSIFIVLKCMGEFSSGVIRPWLFPMMEDMIISTFLLFPVLHSLETFYFLCFFLSLLPFMRVFTNFFSVTMNGGECHVQK